MIIGIGGRARSGKTSVGDYLCKCYGFKNIGFADSLKEACRQIFGFSDEQLYGSLKEVVDPYWKLTPRHILQCVGTECMRNVFDKDIWIKAVEKKILESNDNFVISDVRFPNEAEAVQRWGGFLVRVDRPNSGASGGIASHSSETSLDGFDEWDYTLNNDVQVHASLYEKVEDMLGFLNECSNVRKVSS